MLEGMKKEKKVFEANTDGEVFRSESELFIQFLFVKQHLLQPIFFRSPLIVSSII